MTTTFQISADEYVSSVMLGCKLPKHRRLLVLLGLIIFMILGIILLFNGYEVGAYIFGISCSFSFFLPLYRSTVGRLLARRNYNKYPSAQTPLFIELAESGIWSGSENGEGILPWESIVKWRENTELILVYVSPSLHYMIPKRLAKEGFPTESLKQKLLERAGPAT